MLEQPVRTVGLALACALATATLAMVTFVVSHLLLSTIAVLGPAVLTESSSGAGDAVEGVLVSRESDEADDRCRSLRRAEVRGPSGLLDRCATRRAGEAPARP